MSRFVEAFCAHLDQVGIPFELAPTRPGHFEVMCHPQDRPRLENILIASVSHWGWDRLYRAPSTRAWRSWIGRWDYHIMSISGDKCIFITLSTTLHQTSFRDWGIQQLHYLAYLLQFLIFRRGSWHVISEEAYWKHKVELEQWVLRLMHQHWVTRLVILSPRDWGLRWILACWAYFSGAMILWVRPHSTAVFSERRALATHIGKWQRIA